MTEAEWLACTDPKPMLTFLRGKASDRKLRLFAVACCRRSWEQLTDEKLRLCINTAELFAEGKASQKKRGHVFAAAKKSGTTFKTSPPCVAFAARLCSVKNIRLWINTIWYQSIGRAIQHHSSSAALLREVIGNPFHAAPVVPQSVLAWNDECVFKLARDIYDEKRYEAMPILADALLDAGCDNEELLAHCRGDGPHVRGCWALDLILGNS